MKILCCFFIMWPLADASTTIFHSGMGESDCKGNMIINVGDTVIWTNNEEQPRKVVSVDKSDKPNGIIQSEIIYNGESYMYRFTEVGDHEYYCMKPHNKHGFIHVAGTTNPSQEFDSSSGIKYETPVWFEKLLDWYDQKQISKDDVSGVIKFLTDKGIIVTK